MLVVYVAGPYRAPHAWAIEQNIRKAEELALKLWTRGVAAICPHANTRFYQGALPDELWLEGDLAIMRRCDAVVLVEGWEHSTGTLHEKDVAERLHMPVFTTLEAFELWHGVWGVKEEQDGTELSRSRFE